MSTLTRYVLRLRGRNVVTIEATDEHIAQLYAARALGRHVWKDALADGYTLEQEGQ